MYLYAWTLTCTALAVVSAMLAAGLRFGPWIPTLALVGVALAVERQTVRLTPTLYASVASLPFLFAAVVYGPLTAVAVGAAGVLVDLVRRDDPHAFLRWLVWTANRSLVAAAAGLAALSLGAPTTDAFGVLLAAVALASAVETIADLALTSITIVIRGKGSLADATRAVGPLLMASIPLYTPVLAVLAYSYRAVSPWSAVLFVLPAYAAQRLFLLYRHQREASEELATVNERLEKANLSFATALVSTLDARDRYTAGHSAAVAVYSRDIAARMGLSVGQQELVHLCGLVHDIGKIGLPVGLLEKPGPLSLEERRQMEQHTVIGERILANVADYSEIAHVVRHHHERVDGQGYPDRLSGPEIPVLARIIAVADAYNAMTSDRPYRDAMPSRVARMRLAQAVESQFDTSVVAAFEAILAGSSDEYRSGQVRGFSFLSAHHSEDLGAANENPLGLGASGRPAFAIER
ncbi:MAG: HD-GYP domain-containing protein [Actinomycetota bacterium]|nr:HD-GYP domain-containing protein [Actinomycetota bacterium]